jgi:multiple sugar transport system permease protein
VGRAQPALTRAAGFRRRTLRPLGIYAGLTPFLVIALFPVLWMVVTAFKHERDLYAMRFPFWFHEPPTLKHFHLLFTQTWFGMWLLNTAAVSVGVVAITLAVAVPAAYALARLRLPAAHGVGVAIFSAYLVPPIILFIPLAPLVAKLGVMDSWWALVLLYPTITIPFCTWLLLAFFRSLPPEVEEAAWIDGCTVASGLVRVILPVSLPGIATAALVAFTLSMQEYLYALVFSSPVDQKVITVGLPTMLIRFDVFFWGALMAGGLLVGVPAAIVFGVVLDRFIQGVTGVGEQ